MGTHVQDGVLAAAQRMYDAREDDALARLLCDCLPFIPLRDETKRWFPLAVRDDLLRLLALDRWRPSDRQWLRERVTDGLSFLDWCTAPQGVQDLGCVTEASACPATSFPLALACHVQGFDDYAILHDPRLVSGVSGGAPPSMVHIRRWAERNR